MSFKTVLTLALFWFSFGLFAQDNTDETITDPYPREAADSIWKAYIARDETSPTFEELIAAYEKAIEISISQKDYDEVVASYCRLSLIYDYEGMIISDIQASVLAAEYHKLSKEKKFTHQVITNVYRNYEVPYEISDSINEHYPDLRKRWHDAQNYASELEIQELEAFGDEMERDLGELQDSYISEMRNTAQASIMKRVLAILLMSVFIGFYIYLTRENVRKESHDSEAIRSTLTVVTVLWIIFSAFSVLAILPTVMIFGGPRTVFDPGPYMLATAIFTFPILTIIGLASGWGLYKDGRMNLVLPFAMIPTFGVALFIFGLVVWTSFGG